MSDLSALTGLLGQGFRTLRKEAGVHERHNRAAFGWTLSGYAA